MSPRRESRFIFLRQIPFLSGCGPVQSKRLRQYQEETRATVQLFRPLFENALASVQLICEDRSELVVSGVTHVHLAVKMQEKQLNRGFKGIVCPKLKFHQLSIKHLLTEADLF